MSDTLRTHLTLADGDQEQQDRARRYVASQAIDPDDCRELLDMLGLGEVAG